MKDAKGHGSDPRGAHSAGVQAVGQVAWTHPAPSAVELKSMGMTQAQYDTWKAGAIASAAKARDQYAESQKPLSFDVQAGPGMIRAVKGGQEIGSLEHEGANVKFIQTHPDYQGRGVATAMMDKLRETQGVGKTKSVNFGTVTGEGSKFRTAYLRKHKGVDQGVSERVS